MIIKTGKIKLPKGIYSIGLNGMSEDEEITSGLTIEMNILKQKNCKDVKLSIVHIQYLMSSNFIVDYIIKE